MPSAHGQHVHWRRERTRKGAWRACLFAAAGISGVLLLCFAAVLFLLNSDWGAERLRRQAELAMQAIAGERATASVGPARFTFGLDHPLALQLQDISLTNAATGTKLADVGRVDFGVRLMPLFGGDLRLGGASISNATITAGAMPSGDADWTLALRDERGLIDPDLVATAVFRGLHGAFDAIDAGLLTEIDLADITIVLPEGERLRSIRILDGKLRLVSRDSLEIQMEADVDGRRATLAGTTQREPVTGRIAGLDFSIAMAALPEQGSVQPQSAGRLGATTLSMTGQEDTLGRGQRLKLSGVIAQSQLDFGARGVFTGNTQLDVTLAAGTHKIEIDKFLVQTGRNSLEFNGAFGPRPPTGAAGDRPVYRYELVSTRTVVAPSDSPEPPLNFNARVSGTFDPQTRIAMADSITVESGSGEVNGSAKVELVKGQAPGVAVAVSARDLEVSAAKQLWPWFAASKARAWVMDHLFGGLLQQASVEFRVLPGRLGNGVPLSPEEIVGSFAVADTRFDTVGKLPPIRDADGVVKVSGYDVEITMSSGAVFLPSGRTVSGKNGTLTVARSNKPPVIGKFDVDIEGEAAAVAEFAALDPINAMRVIQIDPADLSGRVSGHVITDIPFQKGIDPKTLEWMVDLDYKDLSVAKPFSGQRLSDADGHINVEPTQATMTAKGLLNGVPANISMVEPLRPEGPQRGRKVVLTLDDAARKKFAPGLNALVSGPMKVAVDDDNGTRRVVADLTGARLDIPWVGWSKGAGVAATAEFTMQTTDQGINLSDFELTGKTFLIAGAVTISGGQLASARFDRVRLNRDDEVRVNVARVGKGYRIDVDGSGLDARPIIKTFVSNTGGKGGSAASPNFSVNLDVARVTGFNGETLSDVKLTSQGSRTSLTGSSGGGRAVSFSNGAEGGRKQMRIEAADAGALLRFLDLYKNVQGGTIKVVLAGAGDAGMAGQVDARNFRVVNEARLASIVSTAPAGSDGSLRDAMRKDIDTSSVSFERGYAQIARGDGYLKLVNGVVRGPQIGATFQGTLYDPKGQMDMTGTFMPAYGLNRLFGELPLVGDLLGNGRDRGLIGVTFKLDGDAKAPRLQVNPLSVMAPGIFRQIFEFN
ncbi:AsmA-like C-terminal region-containing protein [Mesorhizobium sp. LHD-90]|uniref:AsmA-like C-terminal region-containing protein n=1 Tax=Mesorhizobium sp. LHD-90 TaxID=3071414 RepID=UPI0027E04EE2|nr:AsmA-like C-terminal region-containing protein [Mesorhizobium sp. LHD-90]MDQ6437153.1 AsmA-like C-terminal region-containing protein [Mesorhizobium sp. LHD-90]